MPLSLPFSMIYFCPVCSLCLSLSLSLSLSLCPLSLSPSLSRYLPPHPHVHQGKLDAATRARQEVVSSLLALIDTANQEKAKGLLRELEERSVAVRKSDH